MSICKLHTQWKQDCVSEIFPWRKIPNEALNRVFIVESTTKVKTRLRHIQILRFGGWKRKCTNIRASGFSHKVAQRLKKVGCSPQLSDLCLKTNSSNYNSKVQLLNHNYCWGEGGKNELFMSHMPCTFWGWKRQICRKRANRPLYGHKVCHPLFPAATRMRFFPFQAPSKWWASPLRTSPCSPGLRCLTAMKAIGQSRPHVTIKSPSTRVGVQRGASTLQEGAKFFFLYMLLMSCSHCWDARMAGIVQENTQHLLKWYHFCVFHLWWL